MQTQNLFEAIVGVLNQKFLVEQNTDLLKKYRGAYVSSLDMDFYETEFANTIKSFMKTHKLTPKETGLFHEENFDSYSKYESFLSMLKKKGITHLDFSDSSGSEAILISLK